MAKNAVAVVSCYKRDLNWTTKLLEFVDKIYVYDHAKIISENEFILNNSCYYYEEIPNKACEASAYLKYMMDNYNNLPEKIILIHDEDYSWHHNGSIIDRIRDNIWKNDMYINLNEYTWGNMRVDENGYIDQFRPNDRYFNFYQETLLPYFGDVRKYSDFLGGYKGCAQFIIKKICISRNNAQLYIDLYNYCMSDRVNFGHESGGFGYLMEYTWNIIFGYRIDTSLFHGSWKHTARFIHSDNKIIYAKIGDARGGWNTVSMPIHEEHLFHNIFGVLEK